LNYDQDCDGGCGADEFSVKNGVVVSNGNYLRSSNIKIDFSDWRKYKDDRYGYKNYEPLLRHVGWGKTKSWQEASDAGVTPARLLPGGEKQKLNAFSKTKITLSLDNETITKAKQAFMERPDVIAQLEAAGAAAAGSKKGGGRRMRSRRSRRRGGRRTQKRNRSLRKKRSLRRRRGRRSRRM